MRVAAQAGDRWPALIKNVANKTEYQALVESTRSSGGGRALVIEFAGEKCASCRKMEPKLARFARGWPGVEFYQVMFEDNEDLFKANNINRAPFFEIISQGEKLEGFACGPSKIPRLREKLEAHGFQQPWPRRPDRVVRNLWHRYLNADL